MKLISRELSKTYLSPEQLAQLVLTEIKKKNGKLIFPIDPYKMIKESGIILRFSDFDDLEGIIITDDKNQTIIGINSNRQCQRQRFTAAHEYCHFLKDINNQNFQNEQIICKMYSTSKIEKYANEFASCLLMPLDELRKQCIKYKNARGYVDFESVTLIAEYFSVSFESCLFRIAYKLGFISGDITPEALRKRKAEYKPTVHRMQLIKDTSDEQLLSNMINSSSYNMIDLAKNTGAKFIQNYIYYDNKLEGVEILNTDVNYVLADLRYNKENSRFFKSEDENVVMTLGNLLMQEYLLTTSHTLDIYKIIDLHKKLYRYAPYGNQFGGVFRDCDAVIKLGNIQPINFTLIEKEIDKLNIKIKEVINNLELYTISEYVQICIKIMYKFIVIHPFYDGNGRVSRGLLNWLLRLKKIPPIYIDSKSKNQYYKALKSIDSNQDYTMMNILVYKRILNTMIQLHQYLFIEE